KRRPAAARDLGGFLGYMRPFGSPSGRGGPPSPSMTRSAATPAMQRASRALPEPAGDVVVRARVAGAREDRVRVVVLDQRAGADALEEVEAEERGLVRHARCLLHVVRDDHDRVAVLER